MEFDDELDDEEPVPPLLPAADRLWRHPSEVGVGSGATVVRRSPFDPRLLTVALVAGTLGALLATGASYMSGDHTRIRTVSVPALEQRVEPVTMVALAGQPGPAPLDVVAITQRVGPAIIRLTGRNSSGAIDGSGVMFRSDGYLLTSASVIGSATTLTTVMADTRRVTGRVLGVDPDSDVAVIKVDGWGYPVASLGSVTTLVSGDAAIAIGSTRALHEAPDLAVGQVRAVGQTVSRFIGMIRTDARIDARSAGGALLDSNGVVVGIVMGSTDASETGEWATPIDLAYAAAGQLIRTGKVVPSWLGVLGNDLDPVTAKATGLAGGALIARVEPGSPASQAGLTDGDVIVSIDGRAVLSMDSCMVALRTHQPGERIILHILRAGQERVIMAVLSERPAA